MGLSSRGLWSRGASGRAAAGVTWQDARRERSQERAARKLRVAERAADVAAARYRELRTAASGGGAPRGPMPTWQQLLLLVVGGGLLTGLLVMWLLAAAYVGPAAMLVLPAVAGLVAGFIALRRRRPAPNIRHRPSVADLVRATQELHDAEAALQRARGEQADAPAPAAEPPPGRGAWTRPRPEAT